jgi:hypothetical protein
MQKTFKAKLILFTALVFLVQGAVLIITPAASAASALSSTYVRLDRMKVATATSFRIKFTTSSATATEDTLVVDFNGDDTGTARWIDATNGGLVNTTQATATAACATETGATALPGTLSASGTGAVITVTGVTNLAASTAYCVDFTSASAVTTPTGAGEFHPKVSTKTGGTVDDTTNTAVRIITNEQVTVTGTVPPTFNFALSGNTDSFVSNLSTSATISTTGVTVTVTTNAPSGWIAWAKSTNQSSGSAGKGALKSTTASNYTIPTTNANTLGSAAHTLTNGNEDYGLAVDAISDAANGGTVTADAAYNSVATTKIGVLDTSIYRPIASANGTANGDILTLKERATIAGQTPAATDYTDIITLIGAGQF